mmetsp:Transcript_382/g.692  ORF Transcript_382/g.692 Transcript_382/m.692 type:complete len:345 (+) Transcript_382:55-1089(+)
MDVDEDTDIVDVMVHSNRGVQSGRIGKRMGNHVEYGSTIAGGLFTTENAFHSGSNHSSAILMARRKVGYVPVIPVTTSNTQYSQPISQEYFSKHQSQNRFSLLPFISHAPSLLQITFNSIVAAIILYIILSFVLSIRSDVSEKVKAEIESLRLEVQDCRDHFELNRCSELADISPHLRRQCTTWKACMERSVLQGAVTTRLSAQTIAEVINAFLEPLNFKSLISLFAFGATLTILFNIILTFSRIHNQNTSQHIEPRYAYRTNTNSALLHSERDNEGGYAENFQTFKFSQSRDDRFFRPPKSAPFSIEEEAIVAWPSWVKKDTLRTAHDPPKISKPSFHIAAPG